MVYKVQHIRARTLEIAKEMANPKHVYINSGKLLSSQPIQRGNLNTYSFQLKEEK